ncbi:MAG: DarT ssDNA thymidine ADP-ribosyltransferase family protein [Flavobacteriaceae bacterium]|nr:DarT ssDNA thymidine ADP-ribosyltransferase family protein [Flavobacteriaceae bacterium]
MFFSKYPISSIQGEILVKESIPIESIIEVCFESEEKMSEAKAIMYSRHDNSKFLVDKEIVSSNRYRL